MHLLLFGKPKSKIDVPIVRETYLRDICPEDILVFISLSLSLSLSLSSSRRIICIRTIRRFAIFLPQDGLQELSPNFKLSITRQLQPASRCERAGSTSRTCVASWTLAVSLSVEVVSRCERTLNLHRNGCITSECVNRIPRSRDNRRGCARRIRPLSLVAGFDL